MKVNVQEFVSDSNSPGKSCTELFRAQVRLVKKGYTVSPQSQSICMMFEEDHCCTRLVCKHRTRSMIA